MQDEGGEDHGMEFPAQCFSWQWKSNFSDPKLHAPNSAQHQELLNWIEQKPYLTNSGALVSRAALLQICLGMGLLLRDAETIHFTEADGHEEGTPGHIVESSWGLDEVDEFSAFIKRVNSKVNEVPTEVPAGTR